MNSFQFPDMYKVYEFTVAQINTEPLAVTLFFVLQTVLFVLFAFQLVLFCHVVINQRLLLLQC